MGEEFYFFNLYYWASLAKIHLGFEKFFSFPVRFESLECNQPQMRANSTCPQELA